MNKENENEVVVSVDDENILKLIEPFTFEGVTHTEIDLSGLYKLKARDLNEAARYYNKTGQVSMTKEFDPEFCQYLASKATGLPVECFLDMGIRDGIMLRQRVTNFLFSRD